MYTTIIRSRLIFSFCVYLAFLNTSYCMEQEPALPHPYSYPAIEQPYNPALTELRQNLGRGVFSSNPPTVVAIEKNNERFGKCIYQTMTEVLGITHEKERLKMIDTDHWTKDINLLQYFDQTDNPQQGDVIIYYAPNNFEPLHFGIIVTFNPTDNTGVVRSKWGTRPEIFEHELFALPLLYGTTVRFFTLKQHYQEKGKKIILIKELQSMINKSEIIKKTMFMLQCALIQFASGKNIPELNNCLHLNKHFSIVQKVWFILKSYPGLDINTSTGTTRQTLLMLAVIRDDYEMTKLLINLGADSTRQDKDGNTALSIAQSKNNDKIIQLLTGKK